MAMKRLRSFLKVERAILKLQDWLELRRPMTQRSERSSLQQGLRRSSCSGCSVPQSESTIQEVSGSENGTCMHLRWNWNWNAIVLEAIDHTIITKSVIGRRMRRRSRTKISITCYNSLSTKYLGRCSVVASVYFDNIIYAKGKRLACANRVKREVILPSRTLEKG